MSLDDSSHTIGLSPWAEYGLKQRIAWIRGFRHRLTANGDELCSLMEKEVGKAAGEGWSSDIFPLLCSCKWHERNAHRLLKARRLKGTPALFFSQRHRVLRLPLGHIAVIATWNYPVQLLGIQLIQALIAGNRVTVKPSEHAPETQQLLLTLAAEGLPPHTLQSVGSSREAGAELLSNQPTGTIDHVVFTGSTSVGRSIAEVLAPRLIPSTLELSGRDSAIVLHDADTHLASRSLIAALRINHGQTCMAPRRVLVVDAVWDQFVNDLQAAFSTTEFVANRSVQTDASRARVQSLINQSQTDHVQLLSSTRTPDQGDAIQIAIGCDSESPLATEEHFGPAMAVVRVRDESDAIRIHRRCDQHLATMVFSQENGIGTRLAPSLGVSTITVNDALIPQGHPASALSGRHASGWGSSRGVAGLRAMTHETHVSVTGKRLRIPTDPIVGKKLDQFRSLMHLLYGHGIRRKSKQGKETPHAEQAEVHSAAHSGT